MKEVAERQDISLKYLEKILPMLSQKNLVTAVHGKGGGYCLTKEPENYTVWEILQAAEGDMAPVACLSGEGQCPRSDQCHTLPMWEGYYRLTREYFEKITLKDLTANKKQL